MRLHTQMLELSLMIPTMILFWYASSRKGTLNLVKTCHRLFRPSENFSNSVTHNSVCNFSKNNYFMSTISPLVSNTYIIPLIGMYFIILCNFKFSFQLISYNLNIMYPLLFIVVYRIHCIL